MARGRSAFVGALVLFAVLPFAPAVAKTTCAAEATPGGEWPVMGHDLAGTRTQEQEHALNRTNAPLLAPAWTFDANTATGVSRNEITGVPIIADGCVFVGSNTGFNKPGSVFAIDAHGGQLVWQRNLSNGVYSSMAAGGGLVYAFVSRVSSPYVVAFDEHTGATVWQTTVDTQEGSDAVSSPVLFDDAGRAFLWVGVSGTLAEGDPIDRFRFRGVSVVLDAFTGERLVHEFSIPDAEFNSGHGNAGAAIWSTMSIDTAEHVGYVGSGNPFNYEQKSERTNAVLKIDLDSSHATFGRVIGYYRGDTETYLAQLGDLNGTCDATAGNNPTLFAAGFECEHLDLDFGAEPNIFTDRDGHKLVGAGQKSGVYHVFDPHSCIATDAAGACEMKPVWQTTLGVPSPVGGIVGSPAFDGTALYVDHSIAGYMASLDRDAGSINWAAPIADGVHWGSPVTVANGVVYTPDLKGFLDAYDAGTGVPLLHRPMELGANTGADPTFTWGGASVAYNTVYVSVGVGLTSAGQINEGVPYPSLPDGYVIAFRPMKVGL